MILHNIFSQFTEKDLSELFSYASPIWETPQGKSLSELWEMAKLDSSLVTDVLSEAKNILPEVFQKTSDNFDSRGCILDIRVGQGGMDAQDWTSMLTTAYIEFIKSLGIKYELLEYEPDPTAGITHATLELPEAFSYLAFKKEEG